MEKCKLERGTKVVPHDKTVKGYGDLSSSNHWKEAQAKGQPFLYYIGERNNIGENVVALGSTEYSGDFFNYSDIELYVEKAEWIKESGVMFKIGDKEHEFICNQLDSEKYLVHLKEGESFYLLYSGLFAKCGTVLLSYDNAVKLRDYLVDMTVTYGKVKNFYNTSNAMFKIQDKEYRFICNQPKESLYLDKLKEGRSFYIDNTILRFGNNCGIMLSYDNAMKLKDYLDNMIKFTEENSSNKKEEVKVVKEYSFTEMLEEYKNGYKGEFTRKGETSERFIVHMGTDKWLRYKTDNVEVKCSDIVMKARYVKVDTEIPVHEAIKLLKEGKPVYCKFDGYKEIYVSEPFGSINMNNILNGKWYLRK